MKFEKLIIRNIASVAEAEIDFTAPPLADARLFLINGPTGAGKSTILDAICLALFATAPRLEGYGQRKGAEDVVPDTELALSSPLSLVRRGASSAEATLIFEGNNGQRYRATWCAIPFVKGAKKGRIQKSVQTLTNLNSDTTLEKVGDIQRAITSPEVVGLDFKRFCRTTMLAQGSFASFLSADETEKARILEKIIGIERFSAIGKAISDRRADLARRLDTAREAIKGITILTDDERAQKQLSVTELTAREKSLREALAARDALLKWLEQAAALAASLDKAKGNLEALRQQEQAPETVADRLLSRRWADSAPLRALRASLAQNAAKEAEIERKAQSLSADLSRMHRSVAAVEEQKRTVASEIEETQKSLKSYEPLQPLIEGCAMVAERAKTYADNELKITGLDRDITRDSAALTKMQTVLDTLAGERQRCSDDVEAKEKGATEAAERAKELDAEALSKDIESIDKEVTPLTACEVPLERYAAALDTLRTVSEAIKALQGKIATGEKESADADARAREAKQAADIMAESVEIARRGCEKSAVALRHKLQKGDRCPVCGHKVDVIAPDEEFSALLRPLEERLGQLKTASQEASEAAAQATASLRLCRTQLAEQQAEAERQRLEADKRLTRLTALLEACSLEYSPATAQTIAARKTELASRREQTAALLTRANELRKALLDSERALREAKEQLSAADSKIARAKQEFSLLEQSIGRNRKERTSTAGANAAIAAAIAELLPEEKQQLSVREAAEFATTTAKSYNDLQTRADAGRTLHDSLATLLDDVANLLPDLSGASADDSRPVIAAERLKTEAMRIAGDLSANAEARRICLADRKKTQHDIDAFHAAHPDLTPTLCDALFASHTDEEIARTDTRLRRLADDIAAATGILNQAEKAVGDHAARRPAGAEDADMAQLKEAAAADAEADTALNREIGSITASLEADDANRRRHADNLVQIQALEADHALWNDLDREFGGTSGDRFSRIACAFILSQLLSRSNYYMEMFSRRYRLEARPDSTEIMVYDRDAGNIRAFNTLSGGESFMVSLALALGLSAFQDSRTSPDTLFIDEGFGTLSADCLDAVTETLERLQNIEGRRVGIISHVEGLRDRIATRITLRPRGTISTLSIEN